MRLPERRRRRARARGALPHLAVDAPKPKKLRRDVVDQLVDYLEQGNVANAVNFPNVSMARESAYRVAIANANVPNMLGQISGAMARAGLNIHNMVNKSRGDMAYTLVDVDSPVSEAVLKGIAAVEGVLSVRYLPGSRHAPLRHAHCSRVRQHAADTLTLKTRLTLRQATRRCLAWPPCPAARIHRRRHLRKFLP